MRKIITGDNVFIISGKDKGKSGRVLKVISKPNGQSRITVAGVNVRKYVHKSQAGKKFDSKEFPIHISNAMVANGDKGERVGFTIVDGEKKRVFKKSGEVVS